MTSLIDTLASEDIKFFRGYSLKQANTFKIGGCTPLAIFPKNKEEAVFVIRGLLEAELPYLTLGNGSNVLIPDEGTEKIIVFTSEMTDIQFRVEKDFTFITADAGVKLTHLAKEAAAHSLTGLEFAYGIPGTVGGAVMMNAGAYGGEIKDVVTDTLYIDNTGDVQLCTGEQHQFGYRKSLFSGGDVVVSSVFKLRVGKEEEIEAKMVDYMSRRKEKQPLEYPSAGSVFKRPEGHFAGALIEQCGLKGFQIGGAKVSEKHAGFIVNVSDATCQDVKALILHIQKTVKEQCGVSLEPEVRFLD